MPLLFRLLVILAAVAGVLAWRAGSVFGLRAAALAVMVFTALWWEWSARKGGE